MIKKPQIISIVFITVAVALFLGTTGSNEKTRILSRASHAEELWRSSGHADATAEAFIHWDEDDPPEVPSRCAKCHSTPGFVDFMLDGVVDNNAPIGTTVECEVCHTNPDTGALRSRAPVTFPSGVQVEGLGPEALCIECHQGRASAASVNSHIADAGLADDDTVSSSLRFQNIHYYAAAATQFGTKVKGGYEYAGKTYDARFSHITGYNACYTCHNPHSLEVELEACNTCHTGVRDPRDIRFFGSFVDYDGDGNMSEGVYYEIPTFQEKLYTAILEYAENVAGVPIVYDSHSHPYFFTDSNGNGIADPGETSYTSFTPRLLKAAYNYQVSQKDPAAYAHSAKYMMQLLYDSTEDLNAGLTNPVDISGLTRNDEGHFDGSAEAWRHWDEDDEVSSSCAKCHSAEGLPYFIENGENIEAGIANGMLCTTCHTSPPGLREAGSVVFPSGIIKDIGDSSNLCMNCHQGRASKFAVLSKIAESAGPYSFTNIHYFPAAAVLYGSEVAGGYEYGGKVYTGRKIFTNHMGKFTTCVECHMGSKSMNRDSNPSGEFVITDFSNHNVHKPNPEDCVSCHGQDVSQPYRGADPARFKFSGIRPGSTPDYDGDSNMTESVKDEIQGLEAALYAQIQAYGFAIAKPIIYDAHTHPYFFNDTNGNGLVDPGENARSNGYEFNAKLLKAAYNYQMSRKEPNGFIHNSLYVAQLLVDSIQNLGGDVSPYTWR